jgi:hypothetical protein
MNMRAWAALSRGWLCLAALAAAAPGPSLAQTSSTLAAEDKVEARLNEGISQLITLRARVEADHKIPAKDREEFYVNVQHIIQLRDSERAKNPTTYALMYGDNIQLYIDEAKRWGQELLQH